MVDGGSDKYGRYGKANLCWVMMTLEYAGALLAL